MGNFFPSNSLRTDSGLEMIGSESACGGEGRFSHKGNKVTKGSKEHKVVLRRWEGGDEM